MRKSAGFALLAIFLGAISLRLSPLTGFLYWGADIGEYFAILRDFVAGGRVSTVYFGWGVAYPYFPGMFFVQGALVTLSPLDVPSALNLVVPIVGALVVFPIFLLGYWIGRETRVGLLAAAFIAVAMAHVYPTTHTAPSTVGGALVVVALLLFLRLRTDRRALVPLFIISGALVVTHHLSVYFLIVMTLIALFVRGLIRPARWTAGLGREVGFLAVLILMTFAFWFGYATPFRDNILIDVDVDPWWLPFAALPILVIAMAAIVLLRRRASWRYRPRYPTYQRTFRILVLTVLAIYLFVLYGLLFGVPGTTINLAWLYFVFYAPVLVLVCLAGAGRKFLDFFRHGLTPTGWTLALVASAIFGALVAPRLLVPYRHAEYFFIPLVVFAAVACVRLLALAPGTIRSKAGATALVGALLIANVLIAVPPPAFLAGWQEGTRPSAIDSAYWTRGYVAGLLAADHTASSIAFGFGRTNATWDTTDAILAPSWAEAASGFLNVRSPSGVKNVTFVWIDEDTKNGAQFRTWEVAMPMSPEAIAKFSESPFIKVFDNGYAQVYWIAWGCNPAPC